MEEAPLCSIFQKELSDTFNINIDNINYLLAIKLEDDTIVFSLSEENKKDYLCYYRKLNLDGIKGMHKVFNVFNSCGEFYEYIKTLENVKKLNILKKNKNFSINFQVEFLFKQEAIEIILFPSKINLDIIVKDVCKELEILKEKLKDYEENYVRKDFSFEEKIKEIMDKQNKENMESINIKMNLIEEENKNLKSEVEKLKDEINEIKSKEEENLKNEVEKLKDEINEIKSKEEENLKNEVEKLIDEINEIKSKKEENTFLEKEIGKIRKEIKYLESGKKINSAIIKENEFDFIELALKNRINKPILSIEKIYQATIDGGDPAIFHSNCDKIRNTLTFIKSAGNRRFGGFTSLFWESTKQDKVKNDRNAFLFSFDKQKIYPIRNDSKTAIRCKKEWGPCFGGGKDIGIMGNPIEEKVLKTHQASYSYNGEMDALSEVNDHSGITADEVEVFRINFK